jgi:hypothetical protein
MLADPQKQAVEPCLWNAPCRASGAWMLTERCTGADCLAGWYSGVPTLDSSLYFPPYFLPSPHFPYLHIFLISLHLSFFKSPCYCLSKCFGSGRSINYVGHPLSDNICKIHDVSGPRCNPVFSFVEYKMQSVMINALFGGNVGIKLSNAKAVFWVVNKAIAIALWYSEFSALNNQSSLYNVRFSVQILITLLQLHKFLSLFVHFLSTYRANSLN